MSEKKYVTIKSHQRRCDRVNGKFIRVNEKIDTIADKQILIEEAVKRLLLSAGLPNFTVLED